MGLQSRAAASIYPGVVESVPLDGFEQPDSLFKGFAVARGPVVFAQSVEGESEGVELLAGVERRTVRGDLPVDAAVLLVVKMSQQPLLGPCGTFEVFRTPQCAVGRRESPENAAVKDCAARRCGVEGVFHRDAAVKSAPAVLHTVGPEGEDHLLQMPLQFGGQTIESFHITCQFLALRRASSSPETVFMVFSSSG